jgi:tyrosyl-tRNA synthetase
MNQMTPADFIQLASRYTVARMIERDDFQKRLSQNLPVSLHELLYPLIQGYDSVAMKSDIELGGTDQKFNLLVGRDLQRSFSQTPQMILTMPLLEGTDGVQKMSKSLGNAIGVLDSPTEMFGKVMSISDDLMWRYKLLLTDDSLEEIEAQKKQVSDGSLHPRKVKDALAQALVARYHSPEKGQEASQEFQRVFSKKELPDEVPEAATWGAEPRPLWKVLAEFKLCPSNAEARRMVRQGAVSIDGEKAGDENQELEGNRSYLLKVGKKRFLRITA